MSKIIGYVAFFLMLMNPLISLSQSCNNAIPAITSQLQDNGNGMVNDTKTGLVWKKCNEGQSWDAGANRCEGSVNNYTWQAALQQAQVVNQGGGENFGKTDWRLPNIKELHSIVERKCWNPAINTSIFPSTPSKLVWSSSSYAGNSGYAWVVYFYYGYDNWYGKGSSASIRLVRSRQ
jgi:hypothetical protein